MIRFLADENLQIQIVRGLLRRNPGVDIVRAQDVGLRKAKDLAVLAWAAAENRILLTHGAETMPDAAYKRLAAGERMVGMFVIPWTAPLGPVIEDLLLIAAASDPAEWDTHVKFLPL